MRSGPSIIFIALCSVVLSGCGRTYVAEEVPSTFEMPAGVALQVKLVNPQRAADVEAGQPFDGVLAEPLYYRRQELDPQGESFEKETLVAPVGAPVSGEGVEAPEAGVGLQLESVTFHGGMSFPVKTNIVVPPAVDEPTSAEEGQEEGEEMDEAQQVTFTLAAPADVALAIDFRDNENQE